MIRLIKKIFGQRDDPAYQEWMLRQFIPAYRRLIDALQGRCTVPRALRTAETIFSKDQKFNIADAPFDLRVQFQNLHNAVSTQSEDRTKVLGEADAVLDEWRAARDLQVRAAT